MIKKLLAILFLLMSVNAFAQEEEMLSNVMSINKSDYSSISNNQKSTAWVLLGVGTVCVLGGILIMNNDNGNNEKNFGYGDNFNSEGFLILGGVVCAAASVPLFIASKRNRDKSKQTTANFRLEKLDNPIYYKENSFYPSIAVTIKF